MKGPSMDLGKRIDFHIHSILSDGVLIPSEIVRRVDVLGHKAIAISDHVDFSNVDHVLDSLKRVIDEEGKYFPIKLIPGVEITHVPLEILPKLAEYSRKKGAKIIIAHGESPVEPVLPGTNHVSVGLKGLVDILAHPGMISEEDAIKAKENNIFLELTSRRGHKNGNKHVAGIAKKVGAKLIVNTDSHGPEDFITQEQAFKLAKGSGLNDKEALMVVKNNAAELLARIL